MTDLWPDDIPTYTNLKPPVAILKEQGALLGGKTSNLVEGVVNTASSSDGAFSASFLILGTAINYSYKLLSMSHSIDMYPLTITTDGDILEKLPAEMKDKDDKLVADSEAKFMEILKAIFATQKVRKVIEAIIALSGVGI